MCGGPLHANLHADQSANRAHDERKNDAVWGERALYNVAKHIDTVCSDYKNAERCALIHSYTSVGIKPLPRFAQSGHVADCP